MSSSLDGTTAPVTGPGRGIGRGIALGLAQSGARVGLLARTGHEIDDACAEIHDHGGTAAALAADVNDPEQTRIAVQRLVDKYGHVELLVNNAAVVWPLGPTQNVDPAAIAAAIAINVIGPTTLAPRVPPRMLDAGWGRIVNVSAAIAAPPRNPALDDGQADGIAPSYIFSFGTRLPRARAGRQRRSPGALGKPGPRSLTLQWLPRSFHPGRPADSVGSRAKGKSPELAATSAVGGTGLEPVTSCL